MKLEGAGTKTVGIIRCDQPRALDLRAHGGKKLEQAPDAIVDEALAKLTPMFEINNDGGVEQGQEATPSPQRSSEEPRSLSAFVTTFSALLLNRGGAVRISEW